VRSAPKVSNQLTGLDLTRAPTQAMQRPMPYRLAVIIHNVGETDGMIKTKVVEI
jgi:hypothetical protein